jgi:TATA-binding protein-associated factor Taf7
MNQQLDFFESHDELSELKRQDAFLFDRMGNIQRGIFKRHDLQQKAINELLVMLTKRDEDIDFLKGEIDSLRKLLIKVVK